MTGERGWKIYEEPGTILYNDKLKGMFEPGSALVNQTKDFHILEYLRIQKWIDNKVAEWHQGDDDSKRCEYLKMTREEYEKWFKDNNNIPKDFLERIEE